MTLDPGMHIGLHLVFFEKTGVTMKQLGVKNYDNQVGYNTPIKFKSTQATTNAPQPKANTKPNKLSKKPKPHASQDSFYADYVLTWPQG
jgi:hypothetical protein